MLNDFLSPTAQKSVVALNLKIVKTANFDKIKI
jgi:hypothetical protein